MNIYKNISILFLVAIFALSSTGIFVVIHECESCGISEIYIDTNYNHEDEHEKHHKRTEHKTCCSKTTCEQNIEKYKHDNCCSDDTFYLKISQEYLASFLKINFEEVETDISFLIEYTNNIKRNLTSSINKVSRPPDLSGIQILHKICVLRI